MFCADVPGLEQREAVAPEAVLEARTPEDGGERGRAPRSRRRSPGTSTSVGHLGVRQTRPDDLEPGPKRIEVVEAGLEAGDPERSDVELERVQRAAGRDRAQWERPRHRPAIRVRR